MITELGTEFTHELVPGIPETLNRDLERLYGSSFAVTAYAAIYHPRGALYTLTLFDTGGEIRHVILLQKLGNRLVVINQLCEIENHCAEAICQSCFDSFVDVDTISFTNLFRPPGFSRYRFYGTGVLDNYILHLPATADAYRDLLSKNLRKNLTSSIHRAKRDYPDFSFQVFEKAAVPPSLLTVAMDIQRRRLKEKDQVSLDTKEAMDRLARQLETHGLVSCLTLDGKVVSVIINTVVNRKLYFHIITHDPHYNYYRPGQIALYLTILHFLDQGGLEFHFLWGEYDYKYQFGGQKVDLYSYDVVRHAHLLPWRRTQAACRRAIAFVASLTAQRVYLALKKRSKRWIRRAFPGPIPARAATAQRDS